MNAQFEYSQPNADISWEVKDQGGGIVARYRRTIALKTSAISGTAGYRKGIDLHTEIHCAECCCEATVETACRKPAGGFVIVGMQGGCPGTWEVLVSTMKASHLQDAVRHLRSRRCAYDGCPKNGGLIAGGGNA